MKTTKEYPATHSMMTSWFGVDADGNVAYLSFDDNGPVPCIVPETGFLYIFVDLMREDGDEFVKRLNYSTEQVQEIISKAVPMADKDWYFPDMLFVIDTTKTGQFLAELAEYAKHRKVGQYCYCLSEELGVYKMDSVYESEDDYEDHFSELIDSLKGKGILVKVYDVEEYVNVDLDRNMTENNIENMPYYVYGQPYNTDHLMQRLSEPKFPMKIDQFPEHSRQKALRFPFRFSETKEFQVAEYHLSRAYVSETKQVGDDEYDLLPTGDGSMRYIRTAGPDEMLTNSIALLKQPEEFTYDFEEEVSVMTVNTRTIEILPELPTLTKKQERKRNFKQTDAYFDLLVKEFEKFREAFEELLAMIQPKVLLVTENAKRLLARFYEIDSNSINIAGIAYRYYNFKERNCYLDEIVSMTGISYEPEKPAILPIAE